MKVLSLVRALFPLESSTKKFRLFSLSLLPIFLVGQTASAAPSLYAYALAFYAETKSGTTGPLFAEKSFSNSGGSRLARSSADYGILRVFAEAHAAAVGGFNVQPSGAQASWQDTITINSPGLTGTQGTLTVKFTIDGSLASSGGGDASRSSYAEATFRFTRDTYVILEGLQSVHYDGSTTGTPFLGIEQTATFSFTYGTPFDIELFIETLARAYNYLGADSVGDLANTATWGGFASVRDSGGNEVINYSATSSSGANYVAPIVPPKPQLSIAKSGSDFQLSWSTNFTDYVAEFSDTLSSGSWSAVTNAANPSGDKMVITIPASGTQRFFRLRQ